MYIHYKNTRFYTILFLILIISLFDFAYKSKDTEGLREVFIAKQVLINEGEKEKSNEQKNCTNIAKFGIIKNDNTEIYLNDDFTSPAISYLHKGDIVKPEKQTLNRVVSDKNIGYFYYSVLGWV